MYRQSKRTLLEVTGTSSDQEKSADSSPGGDESLQKKQIKIKSSIGHHHGHGSLLATGTLTHLHRRSPQPVQKQRKIGDLGTTQNSSHEALLSPVPSDMSADVIQPVTVKSAPVLSRVPSGPSIKEDEELETVWSKEASPQREAVENRRSQTSSNAESVDTGDRISSGNNSINDGDTSIQRVTEKPQDHGENQSRDTFKTHVRDRSFEKSLDNILDKYSDKSLDLNLSVDSKNGGASDAGKSFDDTLGSSSKSGKTDKKKKSSSWYTQMLSPTYKSKCDDFKKTFKDIPKDQRLIVDYSCALQKDILVHGRMFISQNWICFYANIFRWETVLTIACKDITAITKEKTARVIPNAIQVATDKEKYFFTSFGARDKTFMMLFRIWQNALLDQPMPPKELWHWVHYSYGEELGLTSSDDDYVPPPGMEDMKHGSLLGKESTDSTDLYQAADLGGTDDGEILVGEDGLRESHFERSGSKPEADEPTDFGDTTEESEGEVVCSEHEHLERLTHNEVYRISVDRLFELIFTDCLFSREYAHSRKLLDITLSSWQDDVDEDGNRGRTISYTIPINHSAPFGPKSSQTIEKQICYKLSKLGILYVIDAECTPVGIPYADSFYVLNRYCLSRVSKLKTRLRVTSEVRYRKSVWGLVKSMIEKNSAQGVDDCFDLLGNLLKKEVDKQVTQLGQHPSKKKLRKRRSRQPPSLAQEGPSVSRQEPKLISPPTPVRAAVQREERLLKLNADTLVRVVCVVLVLLVMFNALLFYKLWSLESFANVLYYPSTDKVMENFVKYPRNQDDWIHLISQQQQLHDSELDKWREILNSSIILVEQMKTTLLYLHSNLDTRLKSREKYKDRDKT